MTSSVLNKIKAKNLTTIISSLAHLSVDLKE